MNKLTQAAIAGAAGLALLLGGAGTFAMWNASTTVNSSTVTSGVMTIAAPGTPTWMNVSADAGAGIAIPTIATYRLSPGDKVQMTEVLTIAATGNNLVANLTFNPASIAAVGTANAALAAATTDTLVASGTGVTAGTTNNWTITPNGTGTSQVTVTFTISLPAATAGSVAQGGVLDLSALQITLVQNTRS
jgi:alternate signal-mediated exported protein